MTTLHSFAGGTDGSSPDTTLLRASDGNFYGTTLYSVFKMTPAGRVSTVHLFCEQLSCGGFDPFGGLIQATDGRIYGTTAGGGTGTNCSNGCGTIFSITANGSLTTLHNFNETDGRNPYGGLIQFTNGILYGTTLLGGSSSGYGTIFSLDMGLGPFVTFVQASGRVGRTGGILGQGFTGTTSVSLNGVPASFTVVSDTFIKATVPPGATTGYVTVTTPSGTLTSNVPFHVIR